MHELGMLLKTVNTSSLSPQELMAVLPSWRERGSQRVPRRPGDESVPVPCIRARSQGQVSFIPYWYTY
eukprot:scaffold568147_cov30-Prasinocladus_malaysianus.AAC.1